MTARAGSELLAGRFRPERSQFPGPSTAEGGSQIKLTAEEFSRRLTYGTLLLTPMFVLGVWLTIRFSPLSLSGSLVALAVSLAAAVCVGWLLRSRVLTLTDEPGRTRRSSALGAVLALALFYVVMAFGQEFLLFLACCSVVGFYVSAGLGSLVDLRRLQVQD